MNEFRTSEEQQAFEDEASKPTTGDRKQDVRDIWFAARNFFEKPRVVEKASVHIFELRGDTEIPVFIKWAEIVNPGVDFEIPPVGTIVVARDGKFEFFQNVHSIKAARSEESATRNGEYRRMEILRVVPSGPTWLEDLKKIDEWVSGGQSA